MSAQGPVEVRVIFDASKGRGRRRRAYPSASRRPTRRRGSCPGGSRSMALGVVTLVVVAALYYATWWKADPEIYLRLVTKTPVAVGVDIDEAAAKIFGIRRPATPNSTPGTGQPTAVLEEDEFPPARWSGRAVQIAIPAVAYTWLITSSGSFLLLAAAGGALLFSRPPLRIVGAVAIIASLLGLAAGSYYVYSNFGTYRPTDLRFAMGMVVFLGMGMGAMFGSHARRLARSASAALILAAIVTAAGLYVWGQCGALKLDHFTAQFIATAFSVHAAWGVALFPLVGRL